MPRLNDQPRLTEERPKERLCRGLMVAAYEGGLVVEGAPRRYHFHGKAATEVLPHLMSLLDGTRDAEALCAETALAPAQLDQALTVLRDRGLLEYAGPADECQSPPEHVVTCYSRNLGGSGGYRGTDGLLEVLSDAAVLVAGDALMAEYVAADLRECGIAWTGTGADALAGSARENLEWAKHSLVIAIDDPRKPSVLGGIAGWCGPLGIPVLRVAADDRHLELGPCFLADYTACLECLRRGREEASWDLNPDDLSDAARHLAAGWAATEAVALVTRRRGMAWPRIVTRVDCDDWSTERHSVIPYPDCPSCRFGVVPQAPEMNLVQAYEWMVQLPAPSALSAREELAEVEMKSWTRLQTARTPFPTNPRRALLRSSRPMRGSFGGDFPADPPSALDEDLLADVLCRVAGRREGALGEAGLRWTPSGGNLASVELYLITDEGMSGLPGTIFRYDDLEHGLLAMTPGAISLSTVLAGTDLEPEDLPAALVFVSAQKRLRSKYEDFSYRLAHLDAGCASTQLVTVLRAHGLAVEFASAWDERVAELLCLIPDDQIVTTIAGIRRPQHTGGEACR